jgi:hypothetical protein
MINRNVPALDRSISLGISSAGTEVRGAGGRQMIIDASKWRERAALRQSEAAEKVGQLASSQSIDDSESLKKDA